MRLSTQSRRRLSLGVATLSLIAAAQPVLAQETPSTDGQLSEIVVTAQRREENLQKVPISVATLSTESVQNIFSGGAEITALSGRVPGLYAESSNGRAAPRFYIRGLGNSDFDLAASQPVSVIMDEVVMENVTLKSTPIFDIERVEVLRGPQGTLFGRNTPAGIVKFDSAKPSEEVRAQGSLSYGSYGSVSLDAGIGGAIVPEKLSARVSVLYQHRNNWIDNGYTDQDNVYGAFDEVAARAQLLFKPTPEFSLLGNIHYRRLDGQSTPFRANVLTAGSNQLNGNYDRDTVFYDAGGGNRAQYRGWGTSLRAEYDLGGAVLTSITAYEETQGSSRGDIDGGYGASFLPEMGPGFIPFPSDTQDSIDLGQTTQEVRLASAGDGPLGWQVGAFYFDSNFTVLTEGFSFPPPVTVGHQNESWAGFGQLSYQLTEAFKLTGGLRYTEDTKDFTVIGGSPLNDRHVEDNRLSWDVSAFLEVTPDVSLFARVADGFRAPTIQGRDVAFFSPPSVAMSEKILSFEAGLKSELLDRKLRFNLTGFTYTVTDPQFSAVGGAGNLVQLVNADKGKAWGFELDSEFHPSDAFVLTFGASYNNTEIQDSTLAVGYCAQCTVTDPLVTLSGSSRALIDGNPFPNAPEWILDATARYAFPVSDSAEFFVFTDWAYQGKTNLFLYESLEFNTDNQFEGGLKIGYAKKDGSFELAAFARNITDEHNIKGGIDFNNNTAFVNEPRIFGVSLRLRAN